MLELYSAARHLCKPDQPMLHEASDCLKGMCILPRCYGCRYNEEEEDVVFQLGADGSVDAERLRRQEEVRKKLAEGESHQQGGYMAGGGMMQEQGWVAWSTCVVVGVPDQVLLHQLDPCPAAGKTLESAAVGVLAPGAAGGPGGQPPQVRAAQG
jgi:hypothetical protein